MELIDSLKKKNVGGAFSTLLTHVQKVTFETFFSENLKLPMEFIVSNDLEDYFKEWQLSTNTTI